MSSRIVASAIILACSILLVAPARAEDAKKNTKSDQQKILGTWQVTESEAEGKPVEMYRGLKAVFTPERLKLMPRDKGDPALQLYYKLDPDKNPKQIDTTHKLDDRKPILQLGIYELDDDKLKLCLEAAEHARPGKFETKPKGSALMLTLKRVRD
jgi:uncharacterized protein (TIGR03067 family)